MSRVIFNGAMMKEKDWSGLKYKLTEELGESIDITIFRFSPQDESFTFFSRKHSEFDGLGAMASVLKESGHTIKKVPIQSVGSDPGFFKRWSLMFNFLKARGESTFSWKKEIDFEIVGKAPGFSFCHFDKAQSEAIFKSKKMSLSSFLIHSLDKVAAPYFVEKEGIRKWILPLNMRQRKVDEQNYANKTASFILHTGEKINENNLQEELLNSIKENYHWGSLQYTNIARYIGEGLMRKVAKKIRNTSFGYLTHLGKWPSRHILLNENEASDDIWMTASIASRVVPIAAACMIWRDQLVLTLRLHPSLKADLDTTGLLLQDWVNEIRQQIDFEAKSPKVYKIKESEI